MWVWEEGREVAQARCVEHFSIWDSVLHFAIDEDDVLFDDDWAYDASTIAIDVDGVPSGVPSGVRSGVPYGDVGTRR